MRTARQVGLVPPRPEGLAAVRAALGEGLGALAPTAYRCCVTGVR